MFKTVIWGLKKIGSKRKSQKPSKKLFKTSLLDLLIALELRVEVKPNSLMHVWEYTFTSVQIDLDSVHVMIASGRIKNVREALSSYRNDFVLLRSPHVKCFVLMDADCVRVAVRRAGGSTKRWVWLGWGGSRAQRMGLWAWNSSLYLQASCMTSS